MKKILTLALISFALSANSQQVKKDSVLTDSTPLITVKDYQIFLDRIVMDLPARVADPIRKYWQDAISQKIRQWNLKATRQK